MKFKKIFLLLIIISLGLSVFHFSLQNKAFATDPAGWVSPTGFADPDSDWWDETLAYDDDTTTFASNNWNPGWGGFLVLNRPALYSNKVRVNADYTDVDIQEVDIDICYQGNNCEINDLAADWTHVFQGGSESTWNCQWVAVSFPAGWVVKARFRYNYLTPGGSYWLYEFDFYETASPIYSPSCETLEATSVKEDSAILHGRVTDDGGELCQYRFQYRRHDQALWTTTTWKDGRATGESFSQVIPEPGNPSLVPDYLYYFRAQVQNSAGLCTGLEVPLFTETTIGWVSPVRHNDPTATWQNEENAYDDYTATYTRSYHNIGDPVWSQWLELSPIVTPGANIISDGIRFWARGLNQVDMVRIEVRIDRGAGYNWELVYEGGFTNKVWVEKYFAQGRVDWVRIRFHATSGSEGFFWELYEFDFHKTGLSYECEGTLISTNLLENYSSEVIVGIERFHYIVSVPAGTTLRVLFSEDNVNWYNSSGVLVDPTAPGPCINPPTWAQWDNLTDGSHSIDLSLLGWSENNFYYRMRFLPTAAEDVTPVLDEISVEFSTPYPIEACISADPIRTISCGYKKSCNPAIETTLCSISSSAGAHIGNAANTFYPLKVCCKLTL